MFKEILVKQICHFCFCNPPLVPSFVLRHTRFYWHALEQLLQPKSIPLIIFKYNFTNLILHLCVIGLNHLLRALGVEGWTDGMLNAKGCQLSLKIWNRPVFGTYGHSAYWTDKGMPFVQFSWKLISLILYGMKDYERQPSISYIQIQWV